MKIENYTYPKSSFLSVEKDLSIIVDRIMKNKRLQRLLYYTTPDALDKPNLTQEQLMELIKKSIKILPKLIIEDEMTNYLVIGMDDFRTNEENPEFRDNTIAIDIICPLDLWGLGNYALRPYKIAGEIDYMLNNQRLTGIGKLEFMKAKRIMLEDSHAGLCLLYRAVHGEEDKKKMPNPIDEKQFLKDFEDYIEAE